MGFNKQTLLKECSRLLHPYYWINIILCSTFVFLKMVPPFCQVLFGPSKDACELDMRENEILFFLLIIIMVKSRKSGATHTAAAYLASGFIYAKVSFITCSRHRSLQNIRILQFFVVYKILFFS